MTPKIEQDISASGLPPRDKLTVRVAIAALHLLKLASNELGTPIDQLNEDALIRWLKGEKQVTR
jgi:hypothetical protein